MKRLVFAAVALVFTALCLPALADFRIVPVTSPGGIKAWLYEDHSIPILAIEANFLGGAVLDPEGREGAARLMAALLDEGAGEMQSMAFATAREDLAIRLGFSAGADSIGLSAMMLSETRDKAVDLIRLALINPRFDLEPLERIRGQMESNARANELDPQALAAAAFAATVFPDQPYGRPVEGTLRSVAALTVEDVRAAHAASLSRDHLRVAVVGDIDGDALGRLLDHLFGGLPAHGKDLPTVARPILSGERKVINFDAPQSFVVFGGQGIQYDDPDYVAAMVMDQILGGADINSRLSRELRQERGLTYGVYTYLATDRLSSLYMGAFASSNENVGEALGIVGAEWAEMAESGVSGSELARAKRYMTGEYPLRFDGDQKIAAQLLGLQLAGQNESYVNRRDELINDISTEDIARVAQRLLDPTRLMTVIAGKPEGLP